MFQAGAVLPSSVFRLQLLTPPLGDVGEAGVPELALAGLDRPEFDVLLTGLKVVDPDSLTLLTPRPLYVRGAMYPCPEPET
jgi:hypothetical protein